MPSLVADRSASATSHPLGAHRSAAERRLATRGSGRPSQPLFLHKATPAGDAAQPAMYGDSAWAGTPAAGDVEEAHARLVLSHGAGEKCSPEQLIEMVKRYEHLYNPKLSDYRDPVKKESSWLEIAKELQLTVVDVKKRWKNLRDTFAKVYAKSRTLRNGGDGGKPYKWPYFEMLMFLSDTVRPRKAPMAHTVHHAPTDDETSVINYLASEVEEDDSILKSLSPAHDFEPPEKKWKDLEATYLAASPLPAGAKPAPDFEPPGPAHARSNLDLFAPLKFLRQPDACDDVNDVFGRSVAAQLRTLPDSRQPWARYKISEVLFHASRPEPPDGLA